VLDTPHLMRAPAAQDPVALGMTAYIRATFRLRVFGLEHLRIEPGQIFAPSHRSDNDVPLLITVLYPTWSKAVRQGAPWPTFAAMIELFLPGFFAGYPAGLPPALRRMLWPYQPGGVLGRRLQCIPVREPERMRLQELLRPAPQMPLDEVLAGEMVEALSARAAELGRPRPTHAADVLDGAYADLLWTCVERDSAPDPSEAWRAHGRAAVQDFRRLAESLADGASVILFPEGQLSSSGDIGRLQPGLGSLARRGNARRVQPVALAYDPLVSGRTRAYVASTPPIEPERGRILPAVERALHAATALTAGQLAATAVLEGDASPAALRRAGQAAIDRAREEGRPVEPALLGPGRERKLSDALARARRRGPGDPLIQRLARELASARLQ
jgi:1-acyl-sn-glycerol-3-phosphate acyltransferase